MWLTAKVRVDTLLFSNNTFEVHLIHLLDRRCGSWLVQVHRTHQLTHSSCCARVDGQSDSWETVPPKARGRTLLRPWHCFLLSNINNNTHSCDNTSFIKAHLHITNWMTLVQFEWGNFLPDVFVILLPTSIQ